MSKSRAALGLGKADFLKASIKHIFSDSLNDVLRSPAIVLPIAIGFILSYMIQIVFVSVFGFEAVSQEDMDLLEDDLALFIAMTIVSVLVSLAVYGWQYQSASTAVKEGGLSTAGVVRLLGARTLIVALALLIMVMMILALTFIASIIPLVTGGSIAAFIVVVGVTLLAVMMLSFVPVAVAFDGVNPIRSIGASIERVLSAFSTVLAFSAATLLTLVAAGMLVLALSSFVLLQLPGLGMIFNLILVLAFSLFFGAFIPLVWTRLYAAL